MCDGHSGKTSAIFDSDDHIMVGQVEQEILKISGLFRESKEISGRSVLDR